MTDWTAALDELERRLDAAHAVVGDEPPTDPPDVAPFVPPAVSGTPTAEEAARFADLLHRGQLTLARLEEVTESLGTALAQPAGAARRPPAASMIDTRV